jgi:hypothetical protein
VIQDEVSGAVLDTDHEGDPMVQTFLGTSIDSHDDATGALSGAGADSQVASAASSPGAPPMSARDSVRGSHMSSGDRL